jgi:hypothetical protein
LFGVLVRFGVFDASAIPDAIVFEADSTQRKEGMEEEIVGAGDDRPTRSRIVQ